jgi:hypothetical protein
MTRLHGHLDAQTRSVVLQSDQERIRYVQRDRFINHHEAQVVLTRLDNFAHRPPSVRPPCMLIVGDAGSGKSTLLSEHMRQMAELKGNPRPRSVYCVVDAYPNLRAFQTSVQTMLDVPHLPPERHWQWNADSLIKQAIAELGVRIVILDEVHHFMNLPPRERRIGWDWVKWLSTACRISVVCSGIRGCEEVVLAERQLQTRFAIVSLARWTLGEAFAQFLAHFEASLPLKRPSGLADPKMQAAVLHETLAKQQVAGITHGIKQVLEGAAIWAIRSGEERIDAGALRAWRDGYA